MVGGALTGASSLDAFMGSALLWAALCICRARPALCIHSFDCGCRDKRMMFPSTPESATTIGSLERQNIFMSEKEGW